jgi:multimeric flavodoxin WrbA
MKTLIINGSPRKAGGTAYLLNALKKKLTGDILEIDTYFTKTSPCNDCRYCWTNPKCLIGDEMQNVYRYIDDCDNIILASPIYFGTLTGSLLNWASRLQYIWVSKNFRNHPVLQDKNRRGGIILVDGGDGYMQEALAMGKRLLRIMRAEYIDYLYFSGTDKTHPSLPGAGAEIMRGIERFAGFFAHE